ncbi:MAG: three-Cys-motif partner protein TcmP [Candidatus Cloacimonetes bacterium]|nr:three-Cys-motif partner protein TcmP [Candidatus Cloacimonadota bacterium]
MGNTLNFFEKKKEWSVLKDKILDYYLPPYLQKILSLDKDLFIFDCFAGKGKFDDDETGSPIIIAERIKEHEEKNIEGFFIEKKYAKELRKNMENFKKCHVKEGIFEDNIKTILDINQDSCIFLYIDPYGIKSLNMEYFKVISEKKFTSFEMLMNFNSFGFLREGCRILKFKEFEIDEKLENLYELDGDENIDKMNTIADGSYWIDLLSRYNSGKIDMFKTEELFMNEYNNRLKQIFKYVVSIPIKLKTTNLPKYRMVFGTNHEDGLILMADNMNKKWKKILDVDRKGQLVFFEEFSDESILGCIDLNEGIIEIIKQAGKIELKQLIVNLIVKYGISFSESEYKKKLKELEGNIVKIEREPATTPTGKKATALDYKKYNIKVGLL